MTGASKSRASSPASHPPSNAPRYLGHRERLRTRFLEGGGDAMPAYEILEMILFDAIERIDVKPLANTLLSTFGDLNGVIPAPPLLLLKVRGTDQIRALQAVARPAA